MPATVKADRLVGTSELQQILGVTRQRIFQLVAGKDFPEPITALRMGQIWDLDAIRGWATRTGRTLHELPAEWPPAASAGAPPRSNRTGQTS